MRLITFGDGSNIVQRFDWDAKIKSDTNKHIDKLISEHFTHVKNYLHAPIDEKYYHLTKVMRAWRELRILGATSEAHRHAINYVRSIGLVVGIPR